MLRLSVPLDVVPAVALVGAPRRHAEVHLLHLAIGALHVAHPPDADAALHLLVRAAVGRRVAGPRRRRQSRHLSPPAASAAGEAGIQVKNAVDTETHAAAAAAAAAAVVIIAAVFAQSGPKSRCSRRRGGHPR